MRTLAIVLILLALTACYATKPVSLGMTTAEVQAAKGYPYRINTTTGPWGVSQQWVYDSWGFRSYFYFDNGRLVAVAN